MNNNLPFTLEDIKNLSISNSTPYYIYDGDGILKNIERVQKAFSWNEGFVEHFAVKALPNPNMIKLMVNAGLGTDCASIPEIEISKMAGVDMKKVIFTSNQTSVEEYKEALKAGVIINLDAIEQIKNLELAGDIPNTICLRYNPGNFEFENTLIGELQNSKFGMRKDQIFDALSYLKEKNVSHFGIHAMLAGNILDEKYYPSLAKLLFELCIEIKEKLGISIEFLDFAGGVGIPYKPDEKAVNIETVGYEVKILYEEIIAPAGLQIAIHCEMGRYITGPYGYLVCKVLSTKETYKSYVGVDACASNLMRPAMYGAYHEIINLSNPNGPLKKVDVVGPLCENNDKFAVDRELPQCNVGDYLLVLNCGAHAHSMGYQYNGRLRSAEFLKQGNGFRKIRRAENFSDYIATVEW